MAKKKNRNSKGRSGRPDPAQTFTKAVALHQKGETDQAAQLYRQVLRDRPDHAGSLHYLGMLTRQMGGAEEAISLMERSLALAPDTGRYHNNYGLMLQSVGRIEDGITAFSRAIELEPDYPEVHCNLAQALIALKRFEEAETACRNALDLNPDYAEAHNNLGFVLNQQSRFDEAETAFRRAIDLKADYAGAYNNLGMMHKESGDPEAAIKSVRRALEINPKNPEFRYNLAHSLLQNGDLEAGWREHEWRWQTKIFSPRAFPQPVWRGESLADKTILAWFEQGIGDEIMFANMLPDLSAAAKECIVECDSRLATLFERSFLHLVVIPRSEPADPRTASAEISCQIAAGSLGQWFRGSLDQFPKHSGYLNPDAARVGELRERYRIWSKGRPVIGLSWRSGNRNLSNRRSLSLDRWGPILTDRRVAYVNVQYGDCRDEIASVVKATGADIYQDDEIDTFNDLDGLAAQLAALDLTISIDNSTVHLAGALGRPVWVLLPFVSDWRWLRDRDDSPWYPSLRLFRQRDPGDWAGVMTRVYGALTKWIEGPEWQ